MEAKLAYDVQAHLDYCLSNANNTRRELEALLDAGPSSEDREIEELSDLLWVDYAFLGAAYVLLNEARGPGSE